MVKQKDFKVKEMIKCKWEFLIFPNGSKGHRWNYTVEDIDLTVENIVYNNEKCIVVASNDKRKAMIKANEISSKIRGK
jgi:hypothetical protein